MQNFMLSHLKKKKALRKLHFSRSSPYPENYRWDHQGVISFRFLPIFGPFQTTQENQKWSRGSKKIAAAGENILQLSQEIRILEAIKRILISLNRQTNSCTSVDPSFLICDSINDLIEVLIRWMQISILGYSGNLKIFHNLFNALLRLCGLSFVLALDPPQVHISVHVDPLTTHVVLVIDPQNKFSLIFFWKYAS